MFWLSRKPNLSVAWREQLVSFCWLGEVSTHIALMVSFPVLRAGRGVKAQECSGRDEQEGRIRASPWVASRTRRIFDCAVAGLALTMLFPVLALCWFLVRSTSPGPVFFKQRRMGRGGRGFHLYKFRSMYWQRRSKGPSHTVHNDLRITPVGKMLRRYKLDELPQFWNVLKGDMSLVGPRPKLPRHEVLHMPYRPGLTGRATLAFRHEERMLMEVADHDVDHFYEAVVKPIKAELDIRYMEEATFLDDLNLLACTMIRCLHCSVDGRHELRELLKTYAPEHLARLARPRTGVPVTTALGPQAFDLEMKDKFAGDLDDAA